MQRNSGGRVARATSQQHHGGSSSAGVAAICVDPDALDCPICFHPLRLPAFQCAAGHMLCSSCHDRRRQSHKCPKEARAVVRKMGPCGGTDGEARKMHMEGGASRNRIVQLYVRHGHAIDSIWVRIDRRGLEHWTDHCGGHGGHVADLRLRRHEYLTSVEGHYGPFKGQVMVRYLKFVTNLRTLGPYGKEHGMPFALPAGAGGRIIGFHGRSGGKYLNAIGT